MNRRKSENDITETSSRNGETSLESTNETAGGEIFRRGHQREASTIGNSEEAQKTVRFPSSHLTTNDVFVRIDSWRNNDEDDENRFGFFNCSCLNSIRNWSKRTKLILAGFLILLLFFIALAIVLFILLMVSNGNNNNNNYESNIFTTISTTQPTSTTQNSKKYLNGFLSKTSSEYQNFKTNLTSLVAFKLGFKYQNQLIGWSLENQQIYLFDTINAEIQVFNISINLNCEFCQILSIPSSFQISNSSIIYCCSNCHQISKSITRCSVKGYLFDIYDKIIEKRISEDGSSLLLTTISIDDLNSIQSIILNGTSKITKVGKTISLNLTNIWQIETTNFQMQNLQNSNYFLNILNYNGELMIKYSNFQTFINYDFNITNIPPTFISQYLKQSNHYLIAIIYPEKMFVTRFNFISNCISILSNYFIEFKYDGKYQNAWWTDDTLIVWYKEREGANIAHFQFDWPNDLNCDKI